MKPHPLPNECFKRLRIASYPFFRHLKLLQLLAAHQQEIDQLEERLRNDHERQKNLLRNKMIEKRRRKNEELRRSQEISRQRELIEQKQEIETAQDKAVSVLAQF